MLVGPLQLSIIAAVAAFGAIGVTFALFGVGLNYLLAALLASIAAGLVQAGAQRWAGARRPAALPGPGPEAALRQQLDDYRQHSATLRHDLRGVLSPALMMSDRLVNHADPAVQRAGNAVVRSIERATALLADSREVMRPDAVTPAADAPAVLPAPPR